MLRRFFFEQCKDRQISRKVYRWVWGLLTLWSGEDRTWAGSARARSPGSRGQAGLWGSSGSNTERSRTARQPPRPASPRQTRPGARRSPSWHSSWSGEQGYRWVYQHVYKHVEEPTETKPAGDGDDPEGPTEPTLTDAYRCPYSSLQIGSNPGHKNPEHWQTRLGVGFQTVVLKKTLQGPVDYKEIKAVSPKGRQPCMFIGRTDAEDEAPILWLPDVKSWLIGKDPNAGKDWGQEEKEVTEDETVGWCHRLKGHEFEQAGR